MDTGVLIAAFSAGDARGKEGVVLFKRLLRGEFGRVFVTDYIVAELLNYFVAKSRDPTYPESVARKVLGEDGQQWNEFTNIDRGMWATARSRFPGLSKAGLSFTDCTSVAAVERLGLDAILSFDKGFDGFVPRIP